MKLLTYLLPLIALSSISSVHSSWLDAANNACAQFEGMHFDGKNLIMKKQCRVICRTNNDPNFKVVNLVDGTVCEKITLRAQEGVCQDGSCQ